MRSILLCCALCSGIATAGTLFSTFDPGYAYSTSTGWTVGRYLGADVAILFTPSESAQLSSLRIAASHVQGPNTYTLQLATAVAQSGCANSLCSALAPGAVLESFSLIDTLPAFGVGDPPTAVASSLNPLLLAGVNYFLVLTANNVDQTWGGWNWSNAPYGAYLRNDFPLDPNTAGTGGFWRPFYYGVAVEVEGAAVPEPQTGPLVGVALGIAGVLLRRQQVNRARG